MPIVVQKYGGSSVADVAKIQQVARRVSDKRRDGYQVVVVVSAMGDTTDELLGLAKKVSPDPPRRELDMLLTCGERISMALLSMALHELGVPAISFTGSQSGIITDDAHSQARIVEVRPVRIAEALAENKVVIVAGYQGVSRAREVTTLGRGGSDTTAVALAAALEAEACEIYSDVDGVFSADPRVVPDAARIPSLSYEEMQELAHAGARVLNAQAVEFAREKGIVILARSAHTDGKGSRIQAADELAPSRVRAVTSESDLAILTVAAGVQTEAVLTLLTEKDVRARWVHVQEGAGLIAVPLADVHNPESLERELNARFGAEVTLRKDAATVTLVGPGVGAQSKYLRQMLSVLSSRGAKVHVIHATPFQISAVVDRAALAELTRTLHAELVVA